ncbi:MAG: prepilin-type N-terminal cleavage/methylation domain-containing protein [Clostridium sp.]|nr:prepilin-type N-terminal cleavage/methylation domain-containing protein [Clostridium sp.]
MKSQGFTVLETIVSLFIILIVFSGAASSGKVQKNIYKDIESEGFIYEMHDFLTYAKLKSRHECKPGEIISIPAENKIYYAYNNSKTAEVITVPDSMKISNVGIQIPVNSKGRLNKARTIEFENYFNDVKTIKIRVGIDYINLDDN